MKQQLAQHFLEAYDRDPTNVVLHLHLEGNREPDVQVFIVREYLFCLPGDWYQTDLGEQWYELRPADVAKSLTIARQWVAEAA